MKELIVAGGTVIMGMVLILTLSFLLSWPVYMLWNACLVGAVLGIAPVTWLQAWGITALTGLLFRSNITHSKQ